MYPCTLVLVTAIFDVIVLRSHNQKRLRNSLGMGLSIHVSECGGDAQYV